MTVAPPDPKTRLGHVDALPTGYLLHWYRIDSVLGQGGFGITYLAHDTNLDQPVALKEFLPIEFTSRAPDLTIKPRFDELRERYEWGLERFLTEARTLARFDHPSIVRVYSVFERNSTAYMVMRYEEGENLDTLLGRRADISERELMAFLLPVLDGLAEVHRAGFIHRDIKPDNIYVRRDGSPVLIDFGSARAALSSSRTMTILVAPGYAPLEQYYGTPGQQGPWTDIYSLGATLYRAVTGAAPVDAIARSKGVLGSTRDILEPASRVARDRFSERFLAAIDHALCFDEADRPQSVEQWREELCGAAEPPAAPATRRAPASPESKPTRPGAPPTLQPDADATAAIRTAARWRRATVAVTLVAVLLAALLAWNLDDTPDAEALARATAESQARLAAVQREGQVSAEAAASAELRAQQEATRRTALERERDALAARIAELEAARAGQQAVLEGSAARISTLEAESSSLRARVASEDEATSRAVAAERERDELAQRLRDAESNLAALRARQPALETRLAATLQELDERGVMLASAREQLTALQRELDSRPATPAKPTATEVSAPASSVAAVTETPATPASSVTARLARALNEQRCKRFGKALALLEPLAGEGVAEADFALGSMLLDGTAGTADPVRGRALVARAAARGLPSAQHRLGVLFATGQGGARDEVEAVRWYERAAAAGVAEAQLSLATMFAAGRGVERSVGDATRWYERAARAGNVNAQAALGSLYAEGRAVPRNDTVAYAWLYAASRNGDDGHAQELDTIAARLLPSVLEQARRLGEQFVQRYAASGQDAPGCDG